MTEAVSDEDRLREEAARRMERRRRKMMSPEERLAKITGGLVEPRTEQEVVTSPHHEPVVSSSPTLMVEDPPLENLIRDPFTSPNTGGEADMLSSLLSGGAGGPASHTQPAVQYSLAVWPLLALLVRLTLDTEYSVWVGNSALLPFLLVISGLVITRHLDLSCLQSTSLLTAALMLCGVSQARVSLLTRGLHLMVILGRSFSVYFFCFIVSHLFVEQFIDQIF